MLQSSGEVMTLQQTNCLGNSVPWSFRSEAACSGDMRWCTSMKRKRGESETHSLDGWIPVGFPWISHIPHAFYFAVWGFKLYIPSGSGVQWPISEYPAKIMQIQDVPNSDWTVDFYPFLIVQSTCFLVSTIRLDRFNRLFGYWNQLLHSWGLKFDSQTQPNLCSLRCFNLHFPSPRSACHHAFINRAVGGSNTATQCRVPGKVGVGPVDTVDSPGILKGKMIINHKISVGISMGISMESRPQDPNRFRGGFHQVPQPWNVVAP